MTLQAVLQWYVHCTTSQKVASSNPVATICVTCPIVVPGLVCTCVLAFIAMCPVESKRQNRLFRINKVPCGLILDPNIVDSTQTQQLATHL